MRLDLLLAVGRVGDTLALMLRFMLLTHTDDLLAESTANVAALLMGGAAGAIDPRRDPVVTAGLILLVELLQLPLL